MNDSAKQAAIETLEKYDRQFTTLVDLTIGRSDLSQEEKDKARELLRRLKGDLEGECLELERRQRRGELNHIERAYLEPALRKAKVNINTRVNTTPGQKWGADLYGAHIDITWMLSQLKQVKDEP